MTALPTVISLLNLLFSGLTQPFLLWFFLLSESNSPPPAKESIEKCDTPPWLLSFEVVKYILSPQNSTISFCFMCTPCICARSHLLFCRALCNRSVDRSLPRGVHCWGKKSTLFYAFKYWLVTDSPTILTEYWCTLNWHLFLGIFNIVVEYFSREHHSLLPFLFQCYNTFWKPLQSALHLLILNHLVSSTNIAT